MSKHSKHKKGNPKEHYLSVRVYPWDRDVQAAIAQVPFGVVYSDPDEPLIHSTWPAGFAPPYLGPFFVDSNGLVSFTKVAKVRTGSIQWGPAVDRESAVVDENWCDHVYIEGSLSTYYRCATLPDRFQPDSLIGYSVEEAVEPETGEVVYFYRRARGDYARMFSQYKLGDPWDHMLTFPWTGSVASGYTEGGIPMDYSYSILGCSSKSGAEEIIYDLQCSRSEDELTIRQYEYYCGPPISTTNVAENGVGSIKYVSTYKFKLIDRQVIQGTYDSFVKCTLSRSHTYYHRKLVQDDTGTVHETYEPQYSEFESEVYLTLRFITGVLPRPAVDPLSTDPVVGLANVIANSVQKDALSFVREVIPDDAEFNSGLACVKAFQLSSANGIAGLAELGDLVKLLEPIVKILRKPLSLENWRNLLLWWKYGIKCSIPDVVATYGALRQLMRLRLSLKAYWKEKYRFKSQYSTVFSSGELPHVGTWKVRTSGRLTARLDPSNEVFTYPEALSQLINDLGMRLTLANVWDAVPLSFVLDWFVQVGDFCEKVDYSAAAMKLLLVSWVCSHKVEVFITGDRYLPTLGYYGSVKAVLYTRHAALQLPSPPWRLGMKSNFLNHLFDLILLFFHRK